MSQTRLLPAATPASLSEAERAWLAGFFDGEGTVNFRYDKPRREGRRGQWNLRLSVSNTHRVSVLTFAELAGVGTVYCRPSRRAKQRAIYEWQTSERSAESFVELILPFSITKAPQLRLALEALALRRGAPRIKIEGIRGLSQPVISDETHATLQTIADEIRAHKWAKSS